MRLLLDTHIFLRLIVGDDRPSADVQAAILDPQNDVYLSVASTWETTIKYALGRLALPAEPALFFPVQRQLHRIASLAIEEDDFKTLVRLPSIHRDPFDRIIVAQAIRNGLTLVTVDEIVKQYPVKIFA